MADGVNIPAQGTGDTTPKVSTQKVSADTSDVQDVSLTAVVGGVRTRNPTIPVAQQGALPAGTNNIGDVDVLTLPSVTGTVTANIGTAGTLALDATMTGGTQKSKLVDTGGTNVASVSGAGALKVDGSAVTQPVSGTVTANAGTGPFPVSDNAGSLTVDAPVATPVAARLSDGAAFLTTTGSRLAVDGSGVTQPVSGTVTTTPPSNASTNLAQVAGASTAVGHGVAATALRVELPTDGTGIVGLATGANAIGKLAANSGVDIGDVDVTSLPAIPAGNNNIGDVDIASIVTPTSGGYSVSRLLSGASTNATSVKASAGQVYGWHLANAAAYTVFFKLYNKASAPTVGTDTPFMTIPVPAGAAANVEFMRGIAMGTGVAFATTKLVADADSTALVANDLVINLLYA